MTGHVIVEGFKPFTFNRVSIRRSVDSFRSIASVFLPGKAAMLSTDRKSYDRVDIGLKFKQGLKIEIWAGYDGVNKLRFKGFISRLNYTVPFQLECEGYSYLLRFKRNINASYSKGTYLSTVLHQLTQNTGIKLSHDKPSVKIESQFYFKGFTGIQVIEKIQRELLQTVYFDGDVLYVGLRETKNARIVKLNIGYNTIKDEGLKFSLPRENSDVTVIISAVKTPGTIESVSSDGKKEKVKYIRMGHNVDEETKKQIAREQKEIYESIGYEGCLTVFAEPMVNPGDAVLISDSRYPERTATFFVDNVDFEFGPEGGRQRIGIGSILSSRINTP